VFVKSKLYDLNEIPLFTVNSAMAELKQNYWQGRALESFSQEEWEALCDGCGKCCLNKLEDWDTGEIHWTSVACKLLDDKSCQCKNYKNRFDEVPDCLALTPESVREITWLPDTCAYELVKNGQDLPEWHYLKTGDKNSVHLSHNSVQGKTVSEEGLEPEDLENFLIKLSDL